MSSETSLWLNRNVLVGMTEQRGTAWHFRQSDQGEEPNHYPGPIPIEDIRRRLFFWKAVPVELQYDTPFGMKQVPNNVVLARNDTWEVVGLNSRKYQPHQFEEWLVDGVATLMDDDIVPESAGLLRNGSIAWVQIGVPETMKVADVEFRPTLLATTSFNGSIATTYKRVVTVVVCDNTREMALNEQGQVFRIRHTSKSLRRIGEARDALHIVHTMGDEFAREVEKLLAVKVDDRQFERFLTKLVPSEGKNSKAGETRSFGQREKYRLMWNTDERVSPWKGTAYGVLQMVNTAFQHERPVRKNTIAVERTMLETLKGTVAENDEHALNLLFSVVK